MDAAAALTVTDLSVRFGDASPAVEGVSFTIRPGEIVGLVGESGSGKSTAARSVLGLNDPAITTVSGSVRYGDTELVGASEAQLGRIRGSEIAMIFQDPMTSLNPVLTIGQQMTDMIVHHTGVDKKAALARAQELLTRVGISNPTQRLTQYPFEFSGGMRQRVLIAIAVSCRPRIIVADEPTTALDVTVQAQILDLLRELVAEEGLSMLIISHDLGVIAGLADTVCVMRNGRIVESGTVFDVFDDPRHPYTRSLLTAVRELEGDTPLPATTQGRAHV